MKGFLVFIFLVSFLPQAHPQNRIMLLNGKEIMARKIEIAEEKTIYSYEKKSGKIKTVEIENERIFAIVYKDGEKIYLYKTDSLIGNLYSLNEMANFVAGEKAAYENYIPFVSSYFNFAGGIAGGIALPMIGIIAPIIPGAIIILSGIPPAEIKVYGKGNEDLLNDDAYRAGFRRASKSKRVQTAFKYAILGMGIGAAVIYNKSITDFLDN